jgi:hypothetical protein
MHQQVPFDLGVELTGRLRAAYAELRYPPQLDSPEWAEFEATDDAPGGLAAPPPDHRGSG